MQDQYERYELIQISFIKGCCSLLCRTYLRAGQLFTGTGSEIIPAGEKWLREVLLLVEHDESFTGKVATGEVAL